MKWEALHTALRCKITTMYTEPGGRVTIRLSRGDTEILVEVLDTGTGIQEQDIGCVFESFCRINRDREGSGLGLSIARAIVEAHGGRIGVESSPGKGSRFWFNLPESTWTANVHVLARESEHG
jgi:signal transduction histidine kinase